METLVLEKTAYEIERNKPMPSRKHSKAQARLILQIGKSYEQKYEVYSELTLRLPQAPQDFVPDLCLYAVGTLPNTGEDDVQVTIPPLCAIEISSATQNFYEIIQKVNAYFAYQVQTVWLVLPEMQNISVYTAPNEYEIYKSNQTLQDHKLGIALDLKEVFK
ncbi:MAG: Uma2 family endonuclease [Bacteroidetes bacterium]|nr:MAG: Uma2 family endonuclease [Bacteroidota bacterium]